MGGAVSSGKNNDHLIDNLMQADYIKTPNIEKVFRSIDRAEYFLPDSRSNAYKDLAWKSGNIHISAPCIYSIVMENLDLKPGLSFLNVGSGTGYFSTMVGLLLGPFGLNHGIELYADVIQYAYEKLDVFKKTSLAVDNFEFCEPIFIQGNGLFLPRDCQYDRIYCGAACPDGYVNYMKTLIKVGGLLVMPHKEVLLQITRLSDTEWKQDQLLSVTFATLQLPVEGDAPTTVVLPAFEPISLQTICRSSIRQVLRRNAEQTHPELTKPHRRPKPSMKRKQDPLCTIIIPLYGNDERDSNMGPDLHRPRLAIPVSPTGCVRSTDRIRSRFFMRPSSPSPDEQHQRREDVESSSSDDDDSDLSDMDTNNLVAAFRVSRREKFDSGIVEDLGNEQGEMSSDEEIDQNANDQNNSNDEIMDMDSEDEGVDKGKKEGSSVTPEPQFTYRSVIQDMIKTLPLPPLLKFYLNLDREF